jgi:hypothetical protein
MTNTLNSIRETGAQHAKEGRAPLPRKAFETDKFYKAYMDGYKQLSKPTTEFSDLIFFGLGPCSGVQDSKRYPVSG